MTILYMLLEQARRRNMAEAAFAYINSEEGKAAAAELDRLRACCEQAEANYHANQAKRNGGNLTMADVKGAVK